MKIKELKIYSENLAAQIDFYTNTIGLSLIERSKNQAIFQIGNSRFILMKNDEFTPYHFAIKIPCNQENEALDWLKKRVTVLKDGKNEIQDFDFWNAKALYFYDNDQNIVELIARKNLHNESASKFNTNSLLEISEIRMPVNKVEKAYNTLNMLTKIQRFSGDLERFCAMGDDNGLFICINKKIKDWFPTGDKAHSSPFKIEIEEQSVTYNLSFDGEAIFLK